MGNRMTWNRSSATSMRCDPWTVAKVRVHGASIYELWHDKAPEAVGRFDSFDEAKAQAERLEAEGKA